MNKILAILSVLAVLFMVACTNENAVENGIEEGEEGVMSFEAYHPAAVSRANETSFENGDCIGLYITEYDGETPRPLQISGNWANNVATTLKDGVWSPAKKVFWSDNKMDVYAYYPYMTPNSINENLFEVQKDQSVGSGNGALGGYEASDFLWAKAEAQEQGVTADAVKLKFTHSMSRLVVNLKKGPDFEGEIPEDAVLYLHNVITRGRIDFTNGAVVKDMYGVPQTVKMRKLNNETFDAIVLPQRIETKRPLLELVAGGISYLFESSFNFKVGTMHTFILTINSNPEQIEIEIGGSTGGWN